MVLRRDEQRIATLPLVEGTKNDVPGLIDNVMKTIGAAIYLNLCPNPTIVTAMCKGCSC